MCCIADKMLEKITKADGFTSSMDALTKLSDGKEGFEISKVMPMPFGDELKLEGFLEQEDRYVAVLSRIYEHYYSFAPSMVLDAKFTELLQTININSCGAFECNIKPCEDDKICVKFSQYDNPICKLDVGDVLRSMIAAAYAISNGSFEAKNFEIIYLTYNPCDLELDEELSQKADEDYSQLGLEITEIEFSNVFSIILCYFRDVLGIGNLSDEDIEILGYNFTIYFADKDLYPSLIDM